MARWTGDARANDVLEAADAWRTACFIDTRSLFSDQNLWTLANLNELRDRFIQHPIEGGERDFFDKLREQLSGSAPAITQLAAEVMWFLLLFPHESKYGPERKATQIREVWSWSGSPIPDPTYLAPKYLRGIGHPGTAYLTQRYLQFGFFLEAMCRWKALSKPEQGDLLSTDVPWRFVEWLDTIENSQKRPVRGAILYFLFPDDLERNLSNDHRRQIVEAFRDKIPAPLVPAADKPSLLELDRAISAIRVTLAKELGTEKLDFYRAPLYARWNRELARRDIASAVQRLLADHDLELKQCGVKKRTLADCPPVDETTGYWKDPADATNKPLRWFLHLDLSSQPPVARLPESAGKTLHGARRIAFANTAQGKSGAITLRVIPVVKLPSGRFLFYEQWEWLLLFGFLPALAAGSSGQLFEDFDPESGTLRYMARAQPYVFAALIKMNLDEDEFTTTGPKGEVLKITYQQATDCVGRLLHVSPEPGGLLTE